jgi:hypothetical protein
MRRAGGNALDRVLGFCAALLTLNTLFGLALAQLALQDSGFGLGAWLGGLLRMLLGPALDRRFWSGLLSYLRPGFHPATETHEEALSIGRRTVPA